MANSGLLLPTESPKAKQKFRPATWCALLPGKQKLTLTDSEEETIVLAAELNKSLVAETRSGQSY